jgi:glucose-6-phosphate isomerase
MDLVSIDWTNISADAIGTEHGITEERLQALRSPSRAALAAVRSRAEDDLRFQTLPAGGAWHDRLLAYAEEQKGRFENIVVLGIGGSALGNRALHTAMHSPFHEMFGAHGLPRLFVLDNVDPDLVGEFLDRVDPSTCLFNVISKSGSTAETMSQFLIFRRALIERVGKEVHAEHIVVTTDANAGVLRPIVQEEGYASFDVPDGVGGRFSVLSAVGLLSSALIGIDTSGLLKGAADMDERCKTDELFENPALMLAGIQSCMQQEKNKPIAVTFAYGHRLRHLADWYAQLLAESIGKRLDRDGREVFAGPTPVRAVGVTDQHSQSQLYVEGPHDKWFTLLAIEHPDHHVSIPKEYGDRDALAYLGGRSLAELFEAEREGTRIALTEAQRPNLTISFPRVSEHTLGQYLYMMELAVAVMGEHYGVDAFDQPGVEAGKIAAYGLMGRKGFEQRRGEIEAARAACPPRRL